MKTCSVFAALLISMIGLALAVTKLTNPSTYVAAKDTLCYKQATGPEANGGIDWSLCNPSVLTYVKKQGECCQNWAFVSSATLEAWIAIHYGQLYNVSEMDSINCVPSYAIASGYPNNNGVLCGGANNDWCFKWWMNKLGGVHTESQFPFTFTKSMNASAYSNESCAAQDPATLPLAIRLVEVSKAAKNASSMMELLQEGPIASCFYGLALYYSGYKSGIFTDTKGACQLECKHAATIVGYGTDPATGIDYWKIKNTWGPAWGENGYFKMTRGINLCNIENYTAIQPKVAWPTGNAVPLWTIPTTATSDLS